MDLISLLGWSILAVSRVGELAQWVNNLLGKHEEPTKIAKLLHICNPSTPIERGVGNRRIPRSPGSTLAYTGMNKRPCLKLSGGENKHLVVLWPPHKHCGKHGLVLAQKHEQTKLKKQTEINLSSICLCGIKQWKRCCSENEDLDNKVKRKGSLLWSSHRLHEMQVVPHSVNQWHKLPIFWYFRTEVILCLCAL